MSVRTWGTMPKYKLQRVYFNRPGYRRTLDTGLTLEQVQAHCGNLETSSSTCTLAAGKRRTRLQGPWFDSYTEDR
jgi:hypothetical protein